MFFITGILHWCYFDVALRGICVYFKLNSAFVFCGRDGKPYTPSQVSSAFKRATRKAGIESLRFHDLRHDFASNLVQAGIDIYTVKELLGHKDLRMTVRYCHLAPENLRDAVRVLDKRKLVTFWLHLRKIKRGYRP